MFKLQCNFGDLALVESVKYTNKAITVDFKDLAFLMCQPSSHMLRTNANQAQLKMIVDYPGL